MDTTKEKQTHTPPDVLVVGSINHDLTIRTDRLPVPSETVLGGDYRGFPGGKGANQAVGLHRLGAKVRFCGQLGDDHYGRQIRQHLDQEGLDLTYLATDSGTPTGLALITLDESGRRTIVVAPGANHGFDPGQIKRAMDGMPPGSWVVTQQELPSSAVAQLLSQARRRDMRTVLHASPAADLPRDLLRLVDVLVCSQRELNQLSGRPTQHLETAAAAARELVAAGVGVVLVIVGRRGVLVIDGDDAGSRWSSANPDQIPRFEPGFKVETVDGNAASSAFVAGLVHHLNDPADPDLHRAVRFGLAAMAVSLTRAGGQAALPTHDEVETFRQQHPGNRAIDDEQKRAVASLSDHARSIRRRIIRMLYAARSGHPGGSLSCVEILTALYFNTMVYNPKKPDWPERDRLVLSKGHAAPALYSTLIEAGFLDPSLEDELRRFGSPLQGHPDRKRCPGVEMSTGSLGQGLSVACGMALGARHTGRSYRVYCILGDGELQEGQVWEAAMTAAHNRLDNLCAVVDYNALQIDGGVAQIKSPIEPLAAKWEAFGWHVLNVDGHDPAELCAALDAARQQQHRPTMMVAHTIKGRGVSFMEGIIEYHGSTLSEEEVQRALAELQADGGTP